jgi:serine/threonine-protein kinase
VGVLTPLERLAPVTLEAWAKPKLYPRQDCQIVIGSDIPTNHGIGAAVCEAVLSAAS